MGKIKKTSKSTKVVAPSRKSKDSGKIISTDQKDEVKKKKGKKSHILKVSSTASGVQKIISKKDKLKQKNQKLKDKIELTKAAFKEMRQKKTKRKKTAVFGDMKPLLDSLPSLDELFKVRGDKTGIVSIDRRIAKKPKTKKERRQLQLHEKTEKMLDRFDHVQKIWRNPEFQKNPRKMIAEQIRQRRLANEMET